MRKIFLILLLAGITGIAQNPQEDLGTWTLLSGRHQIAEKWSIPTTFILQQYHIYEDLQFAILRTGISYHFNPAVIVTLGYDFCHSEPLPQHEGFIVDQNRLFEELLMSHSYARLNLSHRYRFESSWAHHDHQHSLSHRFRYRFKLTHPLYDQLYATAFEEIFLNTQEPYFNQNRLQLGLGYHLDPHYKVEVGYLLNDFSSISYRRIWIGMIFNTDLSKKH